MWLVGRCGIYGGEEKWIQNFCWREVNERDQMEENKLKVLKVVNIQIKSVAKSYSKERLVFSFTLRSLYPQREKSHLSKA